MNPDLQKITEQLDALTERANAAVAAAEADSSKIAEVKALVEGTDGQPGLQSQIATLTAERDAALQAEEFKAMKGKLGTLQQTIEDLKKVPAGFAGIEVGEEGKGLDADDPYASGQHSLFADVRMANKGVAEARERLTRGLSGLNAEGKAITPMTEGTPSQGGYLVRPLVERQLVIARESDNVMRQLCSKLNVTTNAIQLDQLGLTTTAGWVAELAEKPGSQSMTLASITASVFTAAGLAVISNQLLADSNPAVDGLVTADIVKRLVALEEAAFLSGTGTNQPLGLLNTPGLGATALTATDVPTLLTSILTAISSVESNHGAPSAILMHPRTWTRIILAQMTGTVPNPAAFIIGGEFNAQQSRTLANGPQKTLWGYPVVTTNRMPTNLGTGTNESRVIVGDFREALILDRQGITVDESPHVFFTSNQTVFRAEQRVGFTAARTPLAFNVVGGVGLANG